MKKVITETKSIAERFGLVSHLWELASKTTKTKYIDVCIGMVFIVFQEFTV